MVRFDYKAGNLFLQAFALYHSDYCSLGPTPGTASTSAKSPIYMRDAILPEFATHIAFKKPGIQIGAIGSVKTIKPRQYTMANYSDPNTRFKTNEKLTTASAQAYAQCQVAKFVVKAQATYTQNTTESLQIGGYAVSALDPATGHEKYTPTQYMNYWLNVDYGKKVQVGMFLGYLNSLGTLDNVYVSPQGKSIWYARGYAPDNNNIKYMYRVSPHLFYNVNNFQLGAEFEYTVAAYGEVQNDQKAKIINTSEIANFRTNILICFYF